MLLSPSLHQSFPPMLYDQAESSIEIDVQQLKKHPNVIINCLGENYPDHFIPEPSSRKHNVQWAAMDTKTNLVVFMVSLLISACMSWFQASHKQITMLLKGITLIAQVPGGDAAAACIPGCADGIYSFLDIDNTTFLVLPICPQCNDVYPPDPTGNTRCPCCDI